MSVKYKLIYFAEKGRGEPIRWLFAYGNIPYEDYRVSSLDDWAKMKPTTPFGKLPILEVEGTKIIESIAITRYVAKLVNLTGKNDLEAAKIDGIVDVYTDFLKSLYTGIMEKDEEAKRAKLEEFKQTTSPFYLSRLDGIVKENNGCFVNGQLTWADIYFAAVTEYLSNYYNLTEYSNLKALYDKVLSIPQIKSWIEKRPPSVSH